MSDYCVDLEKQLIDFHNTAQALLAARPTGYTAEEIAKVERAKTEIKHSHTRAARARWPRPAKETT